MGKVEKWLAVLKASFDAMQTTGPKNLLRRMTLEAEEHGLTESPTEILLEYAATKNNAVHEELSDRLGKWDFEGGKPAWTTTERSTVERRAEIYKLLALPTEVSTAFDKHLPPKTDVEQDLVITDHADGWYTSDFLRGREFYWPEYRQYLAKKKGMSNDTLNSLNESANRILENLAPPHSDKPLPRRGLVVGYVQSGKTTNFTAVVAKAIDAGYRLIIILAGTIDLLRLQTQRRLDMELVGLENLGLDVTASDHEYARDPAFPSKFISYGEKPGHKGFANIKRLTSSNGDFQSIDKSLQTIAFDELKDGKKAFTLAAIKNTNVRLIVIKKNGARLNSLAREIRHNKDVRHDLPTLIIDDESDQASVNTVNPDKATLNERSKINAAIVEILTLLPRAQYVGYTATPFANVFVDPNDSADIYPRDFIVSLPRPDGYMGVRDFHDLDADPENPVTPNKDAFVRQFRGNDEESVNAALDQALDAFMLAGALKLFRESRGVKADYRHHTMMVHETVKNADQFDRLEEIKRRWLSAGYGSTGRGPARLKALLENDFRKVWQKREPDLPFPKDYDELKPFVGKAYARIGEKPVLVVNGDKTADDPGFDSEEHVWKIIIGGAKLSRGFTVEGLTVTFFRRRARAQDTIMQMGRWFGYRGGYRDLVRLYLEEGDDAAYDLYSAFESICRDEETFREQLKIYAKPTDGGRPIRPIEVPAVVHNSFPGVMPTSRNKMFNTRLVSAVLSDEWRSPTAVAQNKSDVRTNWNALQKLVGTNLREYQIDDSTWFGTKVSNIQYADFLDSLRWDAGAEVVSPQADFFRNSPHAAKKWVVLFPQLVEPSEHDVQLGGRTISVHGRSKKNESFNIFSSSSHVKSVEAELAEPNGQLVGVGVALVYPTREIPPKGSNAKVTVFDQPLVGLAMYHPAVRAKVPQAVFTVRNAKMKDAVAVPSK